MRQIVAAPLAGRGRAGSRYTPLERRRSDARFTLQRPPRSGHRPYRPVRCSAIDNQEFDHGRTSGQRDTGIEWPVGGDGCPGQRLAGLPAEQFADARRPRVARRRELVDRSRPCVRPCKPPSEASHFASLRWLFGIPEPVRSIQATISFAAPERSLAARWTPGRSHAVTHRPASRAPAQRLRPLPDFSGRAGARPPPRRLPHGGTPTARGRRPAPGRRHGGRRYGRRFLRAGRPGRCARRRAV